jgi:hypothetical protein
MKTRPVPPSSVIASPSWTVVPPIVAGDARLAHAARDDGGVRGHAAVDREDPLRGDHPVDVVRSRLPAHEDDALAGSAALRGGVRVEHDPAGRCPRRRVQTLRRHLEPRGRVDAGMK